MTMRASQKGHYCGNPNCGWWIEWDQPHSYALGPWAGHYCFGCEPVGVQIQTVGGDGENLLSDEKPKNGT